MKTYFDKINKVKKFWGEIKKPRKLQIVAYSSKVLTSAEKKWLIGKSLLAERLILRLQEYEFKIKH